MNPVQHLLDPMHASAVVLVFYCIYWYNLGEYSWYTIFMYHFLHSCAFVGQKDILHACTLHRCIWLPFAIVKTFMVATNFGVKCLLYSSV